MDTLGANAKTNLYYKKFNGEDFDLTYIYKIYELCSKNNTKLYCVISPTYYSSNEMKALDKLISNHIMKLDEAKFLNFSCYKPIEGQFNYFVDNVHMNGDGADIFSIIMADSIISHCNVHVANNENIN